MALSREQCIEICEKTLRSSAPVRAAQEAMGALHMAYAYGRGWAKLSRSGSSWLMRPLATMHEDRRSDVRFTMDQCRHRVRKAGSRLHPRHLNRSDWAVKAATNALNDQIAARVSEQLTEQLAIETNLLTKLCKTIDWKLVVGSSYLLRTLAPNGTKMVIRNAMGEPVQGRAGDLSIKTFAHGVQVIPPWEVIRDSSANDPDFAGEVCVGIEKPVPLLLLKRTWGTVVPDGIEENCATMGQLLEFQDDLRRATTGHGTASAQDSKLKAVMHGIWFVRDSAPADDDAWEYILHTYRTTNAKEAQENGLQWLHFGPNPHRDLPLHHYMHEPVPGMPTGSGMVEPLIELQDALSLSWTSIIRGLVMHSGQRYVAIADLLDGRPDDVINRKQDQVILVKNWRPGMPWPPVQRTEPQKMDPAAWAIVERASEWCDRAVNQSAVMRGETASREPVATMQAKRELSETTLTDVIDRDTRISNKLLSGLLFDVAQWDAVDAIEARLGGEFTKKHVLMLKGQDLRKSVVGIQLRQDALRPRTPEEVRDDASADVKNQIIDAFTARMSMQIDGGRNPDPIEREAIDQQLAELPMLLAGNPVEVYDPQHHDVHAWVVRKFVNSPQFLLLDTQQQADMQQHWREHIERKAILSQVTEPQPGGQQSAVPMQEPTANEGMAMPVEAQAWGQGQFTPQLPAGVEPGAGEMMVGAETSGAGLMNLG